MDLYAANVGVTPPPKLSVSEFASREFVLSERTGVIGGRINLDLTPYLRFILDQFTDPLTREINLCFGTQSGKTTLLQIIFAYIVAHDPGPTMLLYNSKDSAKDVSKDRWQQLFFDCPALGAHMTRVQDDFQLLRYALDRMTVRFAWNSMRTVSTHPTRYLIKDEVKDLEREIVAAADDRTKTYPNRKIIQASSPLYVEDNIWGVLGLTRDYAAEEAAVAALGGESGVRMPVRRWQATGSTTVYFYRVPCPHCGAMIELLPDRIEWPRDIAIRALSHSAWYNCQECGGKMTDADKRRAVQAGEWWTPNPGSNCIGFQMSSLYSILGDACTFGEIAARFLRTRKDPERFRTFLNGYLAWPWEEEEFGAATLDLESILGDREETVYRRNGLPAEVQVVTAACDVHKRTLVYEAWGWWTNDSGDRNGALLAWDIYDIDMDADAAGALEQIKQLRKTPFVAKGRTLHALAVGVDSGYKTSEVYEWARAHKWILPVKGQRGEVKVPDELESYILSSKRIDRMPDGKLIPGGVMLRNVNTGQIKRELYTNLSGRKFLTPVDVDQAIIRQLNSEKLVTRRNQRTGKVQRYYVKKRSEDLGKGQTAQNHYLDVAVYNRAVIEVLAAGMTVAECAVKYCRQAPAAPKVKASYTKV